MIIKTVTRTELALHYTVLQLHDNTTKTDSLIYCLPPVIVTARIFISGADSASVGVYF